MSKRDDEPDLGDVGMTTAERRRRRRRGALRVPSDNVPRRAPTSPPVVAPVPEDPALAMSIAYSFSSDEPSRGDEHTRKTSSMAAFDAPVAPDAMATVIDPPSAPVEQADFEMQTREMAAVDLEALGLSSQTTDPGAPPGSSGSIVTTKLDRVSAPDLSAPPTVIVEDDLETKIPERVQTDRLDDVEVEVVATEAETDEEATSIAKPPSPPTDPPPLPPTPTTPPPLKSTRERLRTVALSDDDLEEVRDAVRASTRPGTRSITPPTAQPVQPAQSTATQPLGVLDIEVADDKNADSSGDISIDIEDSESGPNVKAAAVTPPDRPSVRPGPPTPPEKSRAATIPPADTKSESATKPPPPPLTTKAPSASPMHAAAAAAVEPADATAADEEDHDHRRSRRSRPRRAARTKTPRGKPWFVDLFDEDYLRTLPFLTAQATQAEAEFVIDAMNLSPGAQLLDVGCGYGRHAMELAARGYHLVGLDLSTPLLVRGGEEAHRRNLTINFVRGDMRELDFDAQFDGAYCLFSTFGYFDDETNKKALSNIARALRPGGRVLIEILNRDYLISDLPTRVWWEGDGCVVLEEVELNYFSSRIQVNRSVVFDDGRQLEQEISIRAYSLHEVGKLMHAAGFRVLEVSGGYQTRGRFFGNQSRHIIVLAERKESSGS